MAESKRGEIVPAEQPTQALARHEDMFPVLAYDTSELSELIQDNLGGMMPKLQRIPWPTGGNQVFKMMTDEGPKMIDTLTGLIVHHVTNRLFWVQTFEESGGGQRPDCWSADGMIGVGVPFDPKTGKHHPMLRMVEGQEPEAGTFSCRTCPLSQFVGDTRPRCREVHPLYVVPEAKTPDDINLLPIVVSVPPSSLQVWSDFSGRMLQRGISFRKAIVELTLEIDKGGPSGNIEYSKAVFRRVGQLTDEQFIKIRQYAANLQPLFDRFKEEPVDTADLDDGLYEAEVSGAQSVPA